jgi:uncharacterized membrane protein
MGETVIARFSHFVYHTGMLRQIGAFIFMVGVFLIILFLMAETKDGFAMRFLCWGAPLIALSILIWNRTRSRSAPNRFRMMKKILTRSKKEK